MRFPEFEPAWVLDLAQTDILDTEYTLDTERNRMTADS